MHRQEEEDGGGGKKVVGNGGGRGKRRGEGGQPPLRYTNLIFTSSLERPLRSRIYIYMYIDSSH